MSEAKIKYQLHWGWKISSIILIFVAIFAWKVSSGLHLWYFSIASPFLILICIGSLFVTYLISNNGATVKIGPFVTRRVRWEDIEMVYDDNFSSFHLFVFKIRGKGLRHTFGCNNAFANYEDFLRKSILRVRPDTQVDPKIMRLIGFTPSDIGKLYKSSGDA